MKGFLITVLVVLTVTVAVYGACNLEGLVECSTAIAKDIQDAGQDKDNICKAVTKFADCLTDAGINDCSADMADQMNEQMDKLKGECGAAAYIPVSIATMVLALLAAFKF